MNDDLLLLPLRVKTCSEGGYFDWQGRKDSSAMKTIPQIAIGVISQQYNDWALEITQLELPYPDAIDCR